MRFYNIEIFKPEQDIPPMISFTIFRPIEGLTTYRQLSLFPTMATLLLYTWILNTR